MPRKVAPIASAQELDADKSTALQRAGQQLILVEAWATPESAFGFFLREAVVKYFDIDPSPEGILATTKPYVPKTGPKTTKSGGVVRVAPSLIVGAERGVPTPRGKLIILPTDPKSPPTEARKGPYKTTYKIKNFHIRVPQAMSLNSLSLWINKQFGSHKPEYVVTASGRKWYIKESFTDKTKLARIGDLDVQVGNA